MGKTKMDHAWDTGQHATTRAAWSGLTDCQKTGEMDQNNVEVAAPRSRVRAIDGPERDREPAVLPATDFGAGAGWGRGLTRVDRCLHVAKGEKVRSVAGSEGPSFAHADGKPGGMRIGVSMHAR